MRAMLLVAALLTQTACESDEKKYERLRSKVLIAQLRLQVAEKAAEAGGPQCPHLTHLPTNKYLDQCTAELSEAETELALAQRELDKFMGR